MTESHVYAAARTPFGRFGGALSGVRPDDLAALALAGCWRRPGGSIRPSSMTCSGGNAIGASEDNRDVGRMAVLLAHDIPDGSFVNLTTTLAP
ncbi:MAG: hypothetical protein ABWX74_14780 [Aeromicrobium sp.]